MGERQRSDLERGPLLGHLLVDAQRRGSIPQLLRKEVGLWMVWRIGALGEFQHCKW